MNGINAYVKLTDIFCRNFSKKELVDCFDTLSTKEKTEVLVYAKATTPEHLFRIIRNYVENNLAK
jgi:hypothetical protein